MKLEMHLNPVKESETASKRVAEATKKKKVAKYIPTWDEVWFGYENESGVIKKGIFQTKVSDLDKKRLIEVKEAIESGIIGTGVESLAKFTKSKALALYKELKEVQKDSILQDMVDNTPENYILIQTEEQLNELVEALNGEEIIAVDTETNGVNPFEASEHIVGMSLTLPQADKHYYIPVRHTTGEEQLQPECVFEVLKPYLEDESIKKVLHNAKFDIHFLYREGIDMKGLWCDTMVAMHCLNENEPSYALKNLATKYGKFFGFEAESHTYEELFGKNTTFDTIKFDVALYYASKDTHLTYQFYAWIMQQFDRLPDIKKMYFDIELPITEVCVHMERAGFNLDMNYAHEYQMELATQIAEYEAQIAEYFGDININSNQQLAKVLYDDWKLEDVSGNRSVDKGTLKQLASQSEGIKLLLNYREIKKLLSTYIEPLPLKVSNVDGRLHGQFGQSTTVTGRFSSNSPNLQNIPKEGRKMFVAPEGKLIIGADYS